MKLSEAVNALDSAISQYMLMDDDLLDEEEAELQTALSVLRKSTDWHPWPDENPEKDGKYLIELSDMISERITIANYNDGYWFDEQGKQFYPYEEMLHWQPINGPKVVK